MKKILAGVGLAVTLALGTAGCSNSDTAPTAQQVDQNTSNDALAQLQQSQPVHKYNWSQIRQTLQEVEDAQAHTTQTTSFFFNQGVTKPVQSCPSIGFPVASTTQLTNPAQVVNNYNNGNIGTTTIPLIDPNGVYSGASTGTYVLCVNAQGQTYADYWEGFVQTVTGPASWNATTNQIELTGAPTGGFTAGRK